jgi:hypothetical protein
MAERLGPLPELPKPTSKTVETEVSLKEEDFKALRYRIEMLEAENERLRACMYECMTSLSDGLGD